jgi:hypothetical protein
VILEGPNNLLARGLPPPLTHNYRQPMPGVT